tara:strand:+ start:789 stop:971 length:183 start_codon:yes stop_codon:yes gene_type:complete
MLYEILLLMLFQAKDFTSSQFSWQASMLHFFVTYVTKNKRNNNHKKYLPLWIAQQIQQSS